MAHYDQFREKQIEDQKIKLKKHVCPIIESIQKDMEEIREDILKLKLELEARKNENI